MSKPLQNQMITDKLWHRLGNEGECKDFIDCWHYTELSTLMSNGTGHFVSIHLVDVKIYNV